MNIENLILDALEIVSSWDLPEEDFADAVNDQARLMAGNNHDEFLESLIDIIICGLRRSPIFEGLGRVFSK
jgi:hypothetical protein